MASRRPARMIGTVTRPIGAGEGTMTTAADSTRLYTRAGRESRLARRPATILTCADPSR